MPAMGLCYREADVSRVALDPLRMTETKTQHPDRLAGTRDRDGEMVRRNPPPRRISWGRLAVKQRELAVGDVTGVGR